MNKTKEKRVSFNLFGGSTFSSRPSSCDVLVACRLLGGPLADWVPGPVFRSSLAPSAFCVGTDFDTLNVFEDHGRVRVFGTAHELVFFWKQRRMHNPPRVRATTTV